jgi:hypothetical protein
MDLIEMEPRDDVSSTGYALANPRVEYLVLQPSGTGEPFTVTLEEGAYAAEWFQVDSRETKAADEVIVESSPISLKAPFDGSSPVVLYLKKTGE